MAKQHWLAFISLSFILLPCLCMATHENDDDDTKTYIVYMGSLPRGLPDYSPTSHHLRILHEVLNDDVNGINNDATSSLIRSYTKSFNGFAAKLTSDQRDKIAEMDEVVSVFESKPLRIQTTRSWDFMGFTESAIKRNATAESDVIVGIIDSGIWPESESFSDEGLSDVPKKWRGTCGGKNFTCNKKIIGARFYDYAQGRRDTARDELGHGTHTASIAAGNKVHGVNFYGMASGTARGGVPSARIATYAVCDKLGFCFGHDILAAFDDAISDGVDIISLSLAHPEPREFFYDSIGVGSFHAMAKGILTVHSAGNFGPPSASVTSVSPWILTVAASGTDRRIIDKLVLGNGRTLVGNSINPFNSNGSKFPIAKINGDSAKCSKEDGRRCSCFDTDMVKGKIVLCNEILPTKTTAKSQGVLGVITVTDSQEEYSQTVSLPSLDISKAASFIVGSYMNSTEDPKAEIKRSEMILDKNAPRITDFSARGPNPIIADILKPDITAPGVEILAAFSPVASVSGYDQDKRSVKYNILTGTSMSCPHVTGISAYLKALHPDWSPAAIKSAILTTGKPMKKAYSDDAVGEFEYGSGHVNPVQASDPGLVYDISKDDYVEMLCNFGYNTSLLQQVTGDNSSSCPRCSHRDLVKNLNYPLLGVNVKPSTSFKIQFNRTVTNVGFVNSTYKARILQNSKVNISVEPEVLSFKSLNEKKSFVVNIIGKGIANQTAISSSLIWSDGSHNVRSPIVVMAF
ncbi:subtilisin-like protease SBT4.3 [Prosopis cineraria]|uniref:subtilisin-like protease SBT4.3 n=1 Tax=Prosopis cineraria TaxID=364024 RepID=UPI00240FC0AF|nr:subtilisin-like protease SBT4.3 [Prosopis cineraria]